MGKGRKKLSIDVKIDRARKLLAELIKEKELGNVQPVVEPIEPETEVEPV